MPFSTKFLAMSRNRKLGLIGLFVVLLSLVALFVLLLNFNWNYAKPWINSRVSQAIGRPFVINGALQLRWDRLSSPDESKHRWQSWVPSPHFQAQQITIGNPGGEHPDKPMAEIKTLNFSVNSLPLFSKQIVIPVLQLDAPLLFLRRDKDGSNNWSFPDNPPSAWQLQLDQLILNEGNVQVVDAVKRADISAEISSIPPTDKTGEYGLIWKLHGSYNNEKISGSGKAGAVLSLQSQRTPYPIEAAVQVGKTRINVNGTLTKPSDLAALDLHLKISGVSMAQLYPLTGVLFPETSPYQTEGHLSGLINRDGGNWRYEKFSGKMGGSDISGTLEFASKKPRPFLSGSIVSNVLQLEDLAPLIGADSNAKKKQRGAAASQPGDKILPNEKFKTARWRTMDTDVKFVGKKIIRTNSIPMENLSAHVQLQDGVLSLQPLVFGIAGGEIKSDIKLNGSKQAIQAQLKVRARHLKLQQLFPKFQPMQASLGEINGDAILQAQGNSIAALLGSANGEIKALINDGTISKLFLEEIGLNLGNVVLTTLFGDKQVQLNCMASDFSLKNGMMKARSFVIDTEDALMNITGNIDLAKEDLNLTIQSKSKGVRLFSLRAPIYVAGDFKHPKVSVDKGVLALKIGSAIGLAAVAPLAVLIPLANFGSDKESNCSALLAAASSKPTVPALKKKLK